MRDQTTGKFTKNHDKKLTQPCYIRLEPQISTEIRKIAKRLGITLSEAIQMACERLAVASDLPEPKVEEKKISFKF
jgi:antitoxin component of RelBE/YafQ-DinJ toxin-antitoxin module